jgi:hypothetical protein
MSHLLVGEKIAFLPIVIHRSMPRAGDEILAHGKLIDDQLALGIMSFAE